MPPRGASMLLLIDEAGPIGVADVARRLRFSHPLIVRMAQTFAESGLIKVSKDPGDGRRKQLVVTELGHAEAEALRQLNTQLAHLFGQLFEELGCDIIDLLDRFDTALRDRSINNRLSSRGEGS